MANCRRSAVHHRETVCHIRARSSQAGDFKPRSNLGQWKHSRDMWPGISLAVCSYSGAMLSSRQKRDLRSRLTNWSQIFHCLASWIFLPADLCKSAAFVFCCGERAAEARNLTHDCPDTGNLKVSRRNPIRSASRRVTCFALILLCPSWHLFSYRFLMITTTPLLEGIALSMQAGRNEKDF